MWLLLKIETQISLLDTLFQLIPLLVHFIYRKSLAHSQIEKHFILQNITLKGVSEEKYNLLILRSSFEIQLFFVRFHFTEIKLLQKIQFLHMNLIEEW